MFIAVSLAPRTLPGIAHSLLVYIEMELIQWFRDRVGSFTSILQLRKPEA